jgi:signal transduction histidine kinase
MAPVSRPAALSSAETSPEHVRLQPGATDRAGGVSEASRRLRALAALSGSLTDPLTPEEAASVVETQALSVLGASSAIVVTLGTFPQDGRGDSSTPDETAAPPDRGPATLTLVHAVGIPPDVASLLTDLWLDASVPLAEVARTGEPVFLHSEAELRRYPEWGDAIVRAGSRAAAAVPVWANGHLRGVLGLTWETPHAFDEDERAFVLTLGVMCAQAIMRARLRVAERQAREAAEHANRAKTQFLRTMSHELRTPMTAVVGYTQLLAEEVSGPTSQLQRDHLRRVRRSSEHLLALIQELLRFARLDAGEETVHVERVLAAEVMEETLDIVRPIAAEKGVRIRADMPDEPIELFTDRLKLRQVLLNLVANAVKYTDVGEVLLIVRIAGVGAELKIFFEVTDSGRGITAADQSHVFEAFWQVDQPLTGRSKGTGLGLSVARQLARLLGGDVVIARSELGRGSTFIASLPARYPQPTPAGREATRQTADAPQAAPHKETTT